MIYIYIYIFIFLNCHLIFYVLAFHTILIITQCNFLQTRDNTDNIFVFINSLRIKYTGQYKNCSLFFFYIGSHCIELKTINFRA